MLRRLPSLVKSVLIFYMLEDDHHYLLPVYFYDVNTAFSQENIQYLSYIFTKYPEIVEV